VVIFAGGDDGSKTWAYRPSSLGDYRRFRQGDSWVLKVNGVGGLWPRQKVFPWLTFRGQSAQIFPIPACRGDNA
jgi:hypothetical protein